MIPEIGHFALILSLFLALCQGLLPMVGTYTGRPLWAAASRPLAQGQFLFCLISFVCLALAFLGDDFSVLYVANNSNSLLPWYYKVSAVWGAHEGSLLLWALILAGWSVAVASLSRSLPLTLLARVLSVMGLVAVGFYLFLLLTSNPFERALPFHPPDGADLNPLLQDFGLIVHPPMLYMGYVGFVVPFAFAIAALLGGRLDAAWARWTRLWTNTAWGFLTLGIALGSWWAYYELGWGGWWFWDPVENASFMPWLMGTALIHSLAVTEKRGGFRSWTVLLAIFAFSLSLLGTFLVRSGVLTSVHAFATDPERGVFILGFLVVVVGVSLLLYAWRAPKIGLGGKFDLASKETMLLSNNVLLAVAAAMVLLGTCYPLFVDALGLGKVSVGAPYFNAMFVPLMVPLVFLMGLGPIARWKKASLPDMMVRLKWAAAVSIATAILVPFAMGEWVSLAALGMLMAGWIIATAAYHTYSRFKSTKPDQPWGLRLKAIPAGFFGMHLAHIGVAVAIIGVTLVTNYETEKDVRMDIGDTVDVGGYTFRFDGVIATKGANYTANQGMIRVLRDGHEVETLRPEKRIYTVQTMPMTEAAIDTSVWRDIYVSLGEPVSGGAWSVRVYHKPFVVWIWGGAVLMALGGILAICDKRYRVMARRDSKIKAESPLAAAGKLATEKS